MLIRKNQRKVKFERKSTETEIIAELNLDGKGSANVKTGIGILDHMLELFAFHGLFDLKMEVKKADTEIDIHHTNEDIGIVLGKIFKKALGDMNGIKRFGFAAAPMESTFSEVILDIGGRGYLKLDLQGASGTKIQDGYALTYLEHFLESFANNLGANLVVNVNNVSEDLHTTLETAFKALGLALCDAVRIESRRGGVPSTKGIID
ncbi:MAG: imidazoleglycerol-phosphate dehydratase [Candidatus Aceula lacicola]|nr:imidazoleglycerol-phosphate dehydratase [Candidatus Aceula lacicola]